jgi:hypothetical protein
MTDWNQIDGSGLGAVDAKCVDLSFVGTALLPRMLVVAVGARRAEADGSVPEPTSLALNS